jgi:hypothetical protein
MILLRNARVPTLALQIDALADPGTLHLCIPRHVCDRLRLEKLSEREVILVDGTARRVPYVVLGAIAMEDLDLVVLPGSREMDVNPRSPDIARTIAARAPGAAEPPGRYALPRASPGRRSSPSAGSLSARSLFRSRASPPP